MGHLCVVFTPMPVGVSFVMCPPGCAPHSFYFRPTVFDHVAPDMALWREEVFGPVRLFVCNPSSTYGMRSALTPISHCVVQVIAVARFSSEEDAIAKANDSEYGLGMSVSFALAYHLACPSKW